MKSAQIFSLRYGYIPSRLPTETHTKDYTARYTTHHRKASSAPLPLLFTQKMGYFSPSPQSFHISPLCNQMLFHLSPPPTPPQPSLHPVLLKEGLKVIADGILLWCTRKRTHLSSGRTWKALWRGETSLSAAFVTLMFVFCIQMCNRKLSSSPLLKHYCIPQMQEPDGVLSLFLKIKNEKERKRLGANPQPGTRISTCPVICARGTWARANMGTWQTDANLLQTCHFVSALR